MLAVALLETLAMGKLQRRGVHEVSIVMASVVCAGLKEGVGRTHIAPRRPCPLGSGERANAGMCVVGVRQTLGGVVCDFPNRVFAPFVRLVGDSPRCLRTPIAELFRIPGRALQFSLLASRHGLFQFDKLGNVTGQCPCARWSAKCSSVVASASIQERGLLQLEVQVLVGPLLAYQQDRAHVLRTTIYIQISTCKLSTRGCRVTEPL